VSPPTFLVVAGEASGDAHAAAVLRELRKRAPAVTFFGMGGERMRAEGMETLYDAREVAVMGISEVLPRLPRILSALRGLARAARERRPAAALLVDLPDFNLRLAARLKREGVPVVYYVSPMVWAWRPGRTRQIAAVVDRLLCIYPFEEPFLRARGVAATYVGNPLLDEPPAGKTGPEARQALGLDPLTPTLALLPGSRPAEVERLFPSMLEAGERLAQEGPLQVVVPVATTIDQGRLEALAAGRSLRVLFRRGRTVDLLAAADAALVASGTATLEALLANRPMVVVYRVSWFSWIVARLLVRVAHVALVNLLAGRRLVPELLQRGFTPASAAAALREVWRDSARRAEVLAGYREVREALGGPGASDRVAEALLAVAALDSPAGRRSTALA
jgi:lipid-A-disaccharide synthase